MSEIIQGDCLEVLKGIKSNSVNCCVTSPPYYGLRDYGTGEWIGGDPKCPHKRLTKQSEKTITGHKQSELVGNVGDAIYKTVCPLCGAVRVDKQIGLEETPEEYAQKLVEVFHEVKRVLKDDGTLWLNLGDSYNFTRGAGSCKQKDLIGIPWLVAFALRADGWYLRQDIIWHKPNPMPESVKDRCTKSHEYIFLLSKNPTYYFDNEAIEEKATGYDGRKATFNKGSQKYAVPYMPDQTTFQTMAVRGHERWRFKESESGEMSPIRNKRDVWDIPVSFIKEAHFATYPEELVRPCILAGCPIGGTVLDPFFGSGTTGRVAESLNREYIGIELNPKYIEIEHKRLSNVQMSLEGFLK